MQAEASCRFPCVPLGFHPVFFSLINICCDAGPGWQRCFWSPSPCKRLEALGAGPAQHPAGRPPPDAGWIRAALAILCQLPRLLLLPAICCSRLLRASPGGNSPRGSPLTVQDGTSSSSSQRGRRRCCPRDPKHCSGALGGTSYVPGVAAVTPGRAIPSPWVPGCPWSCGCKAGVSRGLLPRAGSPAAREAGHQCEAAPGPSG